MAELTCCDMCNSTTKPCTKGWYTVTVRECEGGGNYWSKPHAYDLCPSCMEKLIAFIETEDCNNG